jgi:AcrR family transcriptional regulator
VPASAERASPRGTPRSSGGRAGWGTTRDGVGPNGQYKRESAPGAVGRSGLGEIQRARILTAMSEVVVERGAGVVTVADVVGRSGVSRRTFYELFGDREDCLIAAYDRALTLAGESVVPAYNTKERWRERVRAGLQALLLFLDAEPDQGYLCIVGSPAAGPRALERRAATVETLIAVVHQGARESRGARRPDRLTAEGVVGAVLAILANRVAAADRKPLMGLLNALMAMIVLPYQGSAAAERELRAPKQKPRNNAPPRVDALRDLEMRLTYRTVRVLLAIGELECPPTQRVKGSREASARADGQAPSNRQVAAAAGIADQGQISKLLARLQTLGLIENTGGDHAKGEPNAWHLTAKGQGVTQTLRDAA